MVGFMWDETEKPMRVSIQVARELAAHEVERGATKV
jgi:hypothetical protein